MSWLSLLVIKIASTYTKRIVVFCEEILMNKDWFAQAAMNPKESKALWS